MHDPFVKENYTQISKVGSSGGWVGGMRRTRTSHNATGTHGPAYLHQLDTTVPCAPAWSSSETDQDRSVHLSLSFSLGTHQRSLPLAVLPVDSCRCLTSSLLSNVMWVLSYRPSTQYGTRFFPFNFVIESHWCSSIRGISQIWSQLREESRKIQAW